MRSTKTFATLFGLLVIVVGTSSIALAQGNSGNRPGGRPASSPGVGRGTDASRTGSDGRVDRGFGTASGSSNGRFDTGMMRARERSYIDGIPTDNELRRFTGLARRLDTTPEALRDSFEAARATNSDLKFGHFVAAGVIADNLSASHPEITTEAILLGLENGDSIGRTLRNLGLPKDEAKQAEKEAKKQIKESKKANDQ